MSQATGRTRAFPDVVPADPALRRRALFVAVGAIVPGGFLAWKLERWLLASAPGDPGAARMALWLATGVASALTFAAAVYVAWIALRILRARRFPPPGMRVMRDTPVRIGGAARVLGWAGLACAAVILAAAAVLPLLLARILALM
jgi:hypothetical protein